MKEVSSRPTSKIRSSSSGKGVKSSCTTNRTSRQRCKRRFTCNWNFACKALLLGIILMFIGGSMATVGYFVDHMYTRADVATNDTDGLEKEKSKLNINSITTYVGPMIMGVGGFIVVAACVMTFEQRDNAGKIIGPTRLQLTASGHVHSINRHNKPSPVTKPPSGFKEGSGRKHNVSQTAAVGYCTTDASDPYCRRDLTADFIQFSRNLQQVSLKRKFGKEPSCSISRCPSAPDLIASSIDSARKHSSALHQCKYSRNSLHPLIGCPSSSLSPSRMLQRQALSMDTSEYYGKNLSLPCSKHVSRQGSTSSAGGKGSAESVESVSRRKHQSPHSSMTLDAINDNSQLSRIRDRTKRSDTARRHLLVRQAPIEFDDEFAFDKEFRSSNPQFNSSKIRGGGIENRLQSSSTPHSRRESYSPKIPSVDGSPRFRQSEMLRGSSPTLQHGKCRYLRSNTISNEMHFRRDSNVPETNCRKSSADYNYHHRRKSSNTSDSSRYCSRMNIDDTVYNRLRRDSKSPTCSLKSFQDLKAHKDRKRQKLQHTTKDSGGSNNKSRNSSKVNKLSGSVINRSISPDSLSVSSSATEGHSRADYISIDVEEDTQTSK